MNDFRYAARLACYRHVVVIGVRSVAGIIMLAMQRYRLSSVTPRVGCVGFI